MISRVAQSCFWLSRYLERVESIARMLRVTRSFVLDMSLSEAERWGALVIVAGEQRRFAADRPREARDDGEAVQEFLVWSEENPVSIVSSTRWARENARVIREVISLDLWEGINSFWHWLHGGPGRKEFARNRDEFYNHVVEGANLFEGLIHNTLLHDEPFDFMRLGTLLERVSQTARTIDLKFHVTGKAHTGIESPEELAQWSAILQSCGGFDLYLRLAGGVISGVNVVEFLVGEPRFPRSIRHALLRGQNFLERIRSAAMPTGLDGSEARLERLTAWLGVQTGKSLIEGGLHATLTRILEETAQLCEAIHRECFDPPIPAQGASRPRKARSPAGLDGKV